MTAAPAAVDVWQLRTEAVPPPSVPLSDAERRRASSLLLPAARQRFVLAHMSLRVVLAGYLGIGPGDVEFGYGRRGKPALTGRHRDALCFSLSHAQDAVLIAVSLRAEVGADVEWIRPWPPRSPDAPVHYLLTRDRDALAGVPDADWPRAFTAAWVCTEAVAKAVGVGLCGDVRRWTSKLRPGTGMHIVTDCTGGRWHVADLDTYAGYTAAVACHGAPPELRYHHLDLTVLLHRHEPRVGHGHDPLLTSSEYHGTCPPQIWLPPDPGVVEPTSGTRDPSVQICRLPG